MGTLTPNRHQLQILSVALMEYANALNEPFPTGLQDVQKVAIQHTRNELADLRNLVSELWNAEFRPEVK